MTDTLPNLEYFSSKWHSLGDHLSASCTEVTCVNDECHCQYEAYVRNVKTRAYWEKAYIVSLKNVDIRKNDVEKDFQRLIYSFDLSFISIHMFDYAASTKRFPTT